MTHATKLVLAAAALSLAGCGSGGDGAKPSETRDLAAGEGPSGAMTYYGKKIEVDCDGIAIRVSSTGAFGTSPWVDYGHGIAAVFLAYRQYPPSQLRDALRQLGDVVGNVLGAPVGCPSP